MNQKNNFSGDSKTKIRNRKEIYDEAKENNLGMSSSSEEILKAVKTNVFKRTVFAIIMIFGFAWISLKDKVYCVFLILFLTISMIREIIAIANKSVRSFGFSRILINGFQIVIYAYLTLPTIINTYTNSIFQHLDRKLPPILFYSYISLFIWLVLSLGKNKLKSKLGFFALIHITSYTLGSTAKYAIDILNEGKFWFIFPAVLVIINDIFAYITGKIFGKTQLYKLSPKKTVEGFVGAFIFTAIFGLIMASLHINYRILTDKYLFQLEKFIKFNFFGFKFQIRNIYFHTIPFILVASFIAPFSGLLASAIKRAYKKKDFGEMIPGHGGITDRFDCQAIMVIFTYIYLKAFLYTKERLVSTTLNHIFNYFDLDEIRTLLSMLNERMSNL